MIKLSLIALGIGLISASSVTLYAAVTEHTATEIAWANGAVAVVGICFLAIGLALGPKRKGA